MDLRDNNPQKKVEKQRIYSIVLKFALTGIITAFKEERNMRKAFGFS